MLSERGAILGFFIVEVEPEDAVWETRGGGCAELRARDERRGDMGGNHDLEEGLEREKCVRRSDRWRDEFCDILEVVGGGKVQGCKQTDKSVQNRAARPKDGGQQRLKRYRSGMRKAVNVKSKGKNLHIADCLLLALEEEEKSACCCKST